MFNMDKKSIVIPTNLLINDITWFFTEIPSSLKETIYDVTTPKSDKVKRNLSDRVITPGRGGKREVLN